MDVQIPMSIEELTDTITILPCRAITSKNWPGLRSNYSRTRFEMKT
jgi:hypothetical protein